MKFSVIFSFLAIVQTGTLAALTTSTDPKCLAAMERLRQANQALQKSMRPEELIARVDASREPSDDRNRLIRNAYGLTKTVEFRIFGNEWGPLTSDEAKKQLTELIDQTINILRAARPKRCFGDCFGLNTVLRDAINLRKMKNQMYVLCQVEPKSKKNMFGFNRKEN